MPGGAHRAGRARNTSFFLHGHVAKFSPVKVQWVTADETDTLSEPAKNAVIPGAGQPSMLDQGVDLDALIKQHADVCPAQVVGGELA